MAWRDYIREIPNATMMIRDHQNGWLEFWFRSHVASRFNSNQPWSFEVGGHISPILTFNMESGGRWQMAGNRWVGDIGGQFDVRFTIIDDGLGFPTHDFWQRITYARVPGLPPGPVLMDASTNALRVAVFGGDDGGSPIVEAEIWGSHDLYPRVLKANTNDVWFAGLSPKTVYYFWAKHRNAIGWSDFGFRSQFMTLGIPDAPGPTKVKATGPTSTDGVIGNPGWDGGSPVLESQIGYGPSPSVPQLFRSGVSASFTGLQPGRQYYFWGRQRNVHGWSKWSPRTSVLLHAGSLVRVDGKYRRALVWVKVNGVWRLTKPWVKSGGKWRGTKP